MKVWSKLCRVVVSVLRPVMGEMLMLTVAPETVEPFIKKFATGAFLLSGGNS